MRSDLSKGPSNSGPAAAKRRAGAALAAAMLVLHGVCAAAVGSVPLSHLPAATQQRCNDALADKAVVALRARAVGLLESRAVRQADAWAEAVLVALCAAELPLRAGNVAIVFAFIEKESSFNAHGLLPNQPDALRKLTYRLIGDLLAGKAVDLERVVGQGPAAWVVKVATRTLTRLGLLDQAALRHLFDRQYERFNWRRVSTEWDLENVVAPDLLGLAGETSPTGLLLRAVLAAAPDLRTRLESRVIVSSVGPLQVGAGHAVRLAAEDGLTLNEAQARSLLYTREGGVYYGVKQLRPLLTAFDTKGRLSAAECGFLAADYSLGLFTSRDTALVQQIGRLAGRTWPPATRLGAPEVRAALLALEAPLGTARGRANVAAPKSHADEVRDLQRRAGRPDLEQSALVGAIRVAYRERFGVQPLTAVLVDAPVYSAKTGAYRVQDVVAQVQQRYAANCARLGCTP